MKMLFGIKAEAEVTPPLPREQVMELLVKTWEIMISYMQQGKILAGGALANGHGCYEIFNVDSIEDLHRLIAQVPIAPFVKIEIFPLVTYELALESAKRTLAAVRAPK
jgi:muconolactone delta-isomerase